MSRRERARSFLFGPMRFINDEAVRLMDPPALGGYIAIFCQLWEQPEPGVVPDDDRLLASLARMAPEIWCLARLQVARAFDTTSRPGFWLQKGMIQTAVAQDRFVERQSRYGKAAAKSRWRKTEDAEGNAVALGSALESECAPHAKPSTPSVLGSRFPENLSQHTCPAPAGRASPNGRAKSTKPEKEPDGFRRFYAAYPRHEKPRSAAKAFAAARKRHPSLDDDDFENAARSYGLSCQREEREQRFILHPASWLNADAFMEEFADDNP